MRKKPFLNDDVVAEILIRLPVRPLVRCKCACKRWHSLASDPHLIRLQSLRHSPLSIAGFFLCDNNYNNQYFPLQGRFPGLPDPALAFLPGSLAGFRITSSCNGLFLCQMASPSVHVVCNPTTMEYMELPIPDGLRSNNFFSLAFDPSISPYFNVVSVGNPIHIYSSETRSWKLSTAQGAFHKLGGLYQYRSVYWKGMLIWAGSDDSLLSYNVEKDSMGTLPIPPILLPQSSSRWRCRYFGQSRGFLHFIWSFYLRTMMPGELDVFEMEPDCSGWSVLYHVDLNAIQDFYPEAMVRKRVALGLRHPPILRRPRLAVLPLCVVRGAEGEEDLLLLSIPGKVLSYRLQQKTFNEVCDVSLPPNGPGSSFREYTWFKFHPCTHSLSSLFL